MGVSQTAPANARALRNIRRYTEPIPGAAAARWPFWQCSFSGKRITIGQNDPYALSQDKFDQTVWQEYQENRTKKHGKSQICDQKYNIRLFRERGNDAAQFYPAAGVYHPSGRYASGRAGSLQRNSDDAFPCGAWCRNGFKLQPVRSGSAGRAGKNQILHAAV